MREILYYTLNVISIAFVVYGIYVFWLWHKIARRTDAMLDETKEKYREIDEEISSLRELKNDVSIEEIDSIAKLSPAGRELYEDVIANLRGGED